MVCLQLLVIACSHEEVPDESLRAQVYELSHSKEFENLLIDPSSGSLDAHDAICVAQLFMRKENNLSSTRSLFVSKEPLNTLPIYKSDSIVAYIVNFAGGGFTIVSASKKYSPVLAFSDEGLIYAEDLHSNGLGMWIDAIASDISKAEYTILPHTVEYAETRSLWRNYEKQDKVYTLESHVDGNAWDWYLKHRTQLISETGMSDIRREEFFYLASTYGASFNSSDFEAIFREKEKWLAVNYSTEPQIPPVFVWGEGTSTKSTEYVRPLLRTYWRQDSPYNNLLPNGQNAGCVCIAVSQIVNFYQYPSSLDGVPIDWTLTQVEEASSSDAEVQKLVKIVSEGVETTASGGSNISKAQRFFIRNSYQTQLVADQNSLESEILSELNSGRPVYIRGVSPDSSIGHAFVCDGFIYDKSCRKILAFEINELENKSFRETPYKVFFSASKNVYSNRFFHMNWGWGPSFKDEDLPSGSNTIGWFKTIFDTAYNNSMKILKVSPLR